MQRSSPIFSNRLTTLLFFCPSWLILSSSAITLTS